MPGPSGQQPPSTYSVGDFFDKIAHLIKWWKQASLRGFGQNGEQGRDFDMPFNSPVGSITAGKVVYAGLPPDSKTPGHTSLGYVVQVLTPDGRLLHYQHLWTKSVNVGDNVNVGTILGTSGGCAKGSTARNCITDQWSTGPHIEVREAPYKQNAGLWGYTWENPDPYISKVTGSSVNAASGTSGVSSAYQQAEGGCNVGDVVCWFNQLQPTLVNWGEAIAIFAIALVMIIVGFFLLAGKSIVQATKDAASGAKAVAL